MKTEWDLFSPQTCSWQNKDNVHGTTLLKDHLSSVLYFINYECKKSPHKLRLERINII